jgi:hypothetical protein
MSLLFPLISFNKIPKELEIIIPYINSLENTIIKLLESSVMDFEYKFQQTEIDFFSSMAQIASAIVLHKNPQQLVKQLNEIYFSALAQIEDEISQEKVRGSPAAIAVIDATERIRDYFSLIFDTTINTYLPEYKPAFDAYVKLSVCICSLMKIIKYKNKRYTKNIAKLIQKCQDYTWKLESYVETIEIETDPEQSKILENIKATKD